MNTINLSTPLNYIGTVTNVNDVKQPNYGDVAIDSLGDSYSYNGNGWHCMTNDVIKMGQQATGPIRIMGTATNGYVSPLIHKTSEEIAIDKLRILLRLSIRQLHRDKLLSNKEYEMYSLMVESEDEDDLHVLDVITDKYYDDINNSNEG